MDENIQNEATQPETRIKRTVERSAQYPGRSIEESLVFVAEFYRNFRNNLTKRDDIVKMIDGTHNRDIAAASYYGFLRREKDSYQVTELYRVIANPISQDERSQKLLAAFISPNLNKELVNRFDGGHIPDTLVAQLSRFHRITEDAAPLAADVFLKNARFCGVLNENNVLNYNLTVNGLVTPHITILPSASTVEDAQNTHTEGTSAEEQEVVKPIAEVQPKTIQDEQLLLPEMVNSDKIRIRLTGGRFAYLVYPLDLNKKDISILTKQIEQLDLIIE